MNNELKVLKEKYDNIMSNPEKVEGEFFQSVMSVFSYKKISKGAMFNVRPFEYQRAGLKQGKELKKIPKAIKNTHVYYFDSDDQILLIEVYGQSEGIINREYFFYRNDCTESIYFNSGADSIRNITLSRDKKGHTISLLNYSDFGCSFFEYVYEGDVLVEIDVKHKEHSEKHLSSFKVCFIYNNGELNKIVHRHPNGYEEQRYP